jgi:ABC-2 type transport system ATP-binding protein
MVRNLRSIGKTVFLTTHYMDEAEQLADRAAILVNGKIRAEGNPRALIAGEANITIIEFSLTEGSARPPGPLMDGAAIEEGVVRIRTENGTKVLHELTGWALDNNVELGGLQVLRPSLEDVFLEVTQSGTS